MYIYKITNKLDGKSYIGQTIKVGKNFDKYYGSGILIRRAIKKYGIRNFKKEIIDECCCLEQLDMYERFYIDHFNSKSPNGYNLDNGGNGSGKTSDETKRKISFVMTGRKHTEETKRKISKSHKGHFGYHTEETKRKISESLKGRKGKSLSEDARKRIGNANKKRKGIHYKKQSKS